MASEFALNEGTQAPTLTTLPSRQGTRTPEPPVTVGRTLGRPSAVHEWDGEEPGGHRGGARRALLRMQRLDSKRGRTRLQLRHGELAQFALLISTAHALVGLTMAGFTGQSSMS